MLGARNTPCATRHSRASRWMHRRSAAEDSCLQQGRINIPGCCILTGTRSPRARSAQHPHGTQQDCGGVQCVTQAQNALSQRGSALRCCCRLSSRVLLYLLRASREQKLPPNREKCFCNFRNGTAVQTILQSAPQQWCEVNAAGRGRRAAVQGSGSGRGQGRKKQGTSALLPVCAGRIWAPAWRSLGACQTLEAWYSVC